MSSTHSKKQDSLQELRTGTVQRLSQHFLQASLSHQPPSRPSSLPIRYQPLTIPQTFKSDGSCSLSSHPPPLPSAPLSSSSSLSNSYFRRYSTSSSSSYSYSPFASTNSNRESTTGTTSAAIATALTYTPHHAQQLPTTQVFLRPSSPSTSKSPPTSSPSSSYQSQPLTSQSLPPAGFISSKDRIGGHSSSSVGSEDSFASALSYIDSPKEPGSPRTVPLWKQMLDAIEREDRVELDRILHAFDFAIVIQTLVTWNISNTDNKYRHDPDVLLDAQELLGPTVDHLNLIQIACFLFNEEMALDLLNFVAKASEELESKKILYEFMGKMWGDGNTTLHLASFLGMADLTKRLLDLGANVYKMNDRKYKPVDCADENTTRSLFLNLTEVVRYRKIPQESLPTSPINDVGSDHTWNSFRSIGHMRSPSTSTLPLMMTASEDMISGKQTRSEGGDSSSSMTRPASTLGITHQLNGLLISETKQEGSKAKPDEGASHSCSIPKSGSATVIENLLLTETNSLQLQTQQAEETILSPVVIFKPTASPENTTPSLSDSARSSSPELQDKSNNSLNNSNNNNSINIKNSDIIDSSISNKSQKHTTTTTGSTGSTGTVSPNDPSYASRIRPKLRSYQSSPSIRLHVEKQSTKDTTSSAPFKKSKSTKRVTFDPQSLMADASRTGDLSLYKSMLGVVQEEGKSGTLEQIINHQSASRKLSSLHLAASYNHLELCQFLVEMGANINLTDMEGWTPLHCAAAEGHLAVFDYLAKRPDADLQAVTMDGELLEDVVEDDDLRQKVIDIIEAQSRGSE